jgi:hypothetical protein
MLPDERVKFRSIQFATPVAVDFTEQLLPVREGDVFDFGPIRKFSHCNFHMNAEKLLTITEHVFVVLLPVGHLRPAP